MRQCRECGKVFNNTVKFQKVCKECNILIEENRKKNSSIGRKTSNSLRPETDPRILFLKDNLKALDKVLGL